MTKLAKKTKGAAESGDWLVLRDTASPMLFKLWQQQRVSLALALEAARILSDTDQALAGQVEDPEGYLRSQILAVQRANENRGSAAVRWALRVEYVDLPEKSGRREYETLREAEVDYNIYLTGDVPLSVFFYEVLEDGTEREIERGASPGGIDEAEGVDAARVSASEELLIDPSELTLHPAAEMFPEMTPSEFTALVDHIRVHRQQEPVVIDAQNRIIDGRHRWRACQALANQGLQVWCQRAESLGLHSEDDIREYVIAKNLHRRHLSESQRAMMAAALSANLQSGKGHTVAQAAEKLKVSPRSVASAKKVREKGSPDLVAAVEQGKVSVSAAARAVDSGQLTADSEDSPEALKGRTYLLNKGWAWHGAGRKDCYYRLNSSQGTEYRLHIESATSFMVVYAAEAERAMPAFAWEAIDPAFFVTAKAAHAWVAKKIEAEAKRRERDPQAGMPTSLEASEERSIREITVLERGFLDGNGYEERPCRAGEEPCFQFDKRLKKTKTQRAREVTIDFIWVDGFTPELQGERFVASCNIPGSSPGCGGRTLGFYLTVEEAVEACEHWIETGEILPEAKVESTEHSKVGGDPSEWQEGMPVSVYFPSHIAGVTEGCPFVSPDPGDGEEVGFDFAALCRGVECIRTAGPAAWLSTAKPTQDQVDYLVEFLGRAVPLLGDIAKEFTERIVEE